MFSYRFNVLISKIILKKIKIYIIFIYFQVKNTLKINCYHTQQHPFNKPGKKKSLTIYTVF